MSYKLTSLLYPLLLSHTILSQAATVTLDFEDIPGMSLFTGGSIPHESRLSDQYLTNYGVVFRSGAPYVAVTHLFAGHATSGVNGILVGH